MDTITIAIIGAGSTYTPELMEGILLRKDKFSVKEIRMMDIDPIKLSILHGLCQRMTAKSGLMIPIIKTNNLEEAIRGADFVLAQIRVGGLSARHLDESIPLKYNLLGQETTGVGGFLKALRTIPEILRIARVMEQLAPDAWLINFSNPSGLVAEAVTKHTKVKMIGLCNGPINMVRDVARILEVPHTDIDYDFVGLNHLCWITGVYHHSKEILRSRLSKGLVLQGLKNVPSLSLDPILLKAIPAIPISYLNYFYHKEEQLLKQKTSEKTRAQEVMELEALLLDHYKNPKLDYKPKELEARGGSLYSEAAVSLIESIVCDTGDVHVIDVPNSGALEFLEDDEVVEVKCIVSSRGFQPLPVRNFSNPYIIGLIQTIKAYEKLTVQSAIEGDYSAGIAALMIHPLIGDFSKAKLVFDDMLQAHEAYLPQFSGK